MRTSVPRPLRGRAPGGERMNRCLALFGFLTVFLSPATVAHGQEPRACNPRGLPGVIWWGEEQYLTAKRLVSYAAPVVWFSPDEPSLGRAEGAQIMHPEPFTFDRPAESPVLYYQITDLQMRESADESEAFQRDDDDLDESLINLRAVVGLNASFYAYYQTEEGVGSHPHDIEPASFRLVVLRGNDVGEYVGDCSEDLYLIAVTRTTGKAHGLVWFWNVLDTDELTRFPMHLLVEEGKHAFGTDKNGDGLFTPAYDVNVRVNDAWGIRDNIRTGTLFSGAYQAWMTKARQPQHRVLPPLPEDSPLREDLADRVEGSELATYEIRPFPAVESAGDDEALRYLMEHQAEPHWPEMGRIRDPEQLGRFMAEGAVLKSFSVSLYADGDLGFSFTFPFFIVAHLNDPMTGGYLVHRMYFKNKRLRDFGWMITYMPSASRWMDTYLGAGYESLVMEEEDGSRPRKRGFVMETGLKFRANIAHSSLRFLPFTDFWGVRVGVKNWGFWAIDRMTYVLELGAGSF
ncbi:MAG: hypothetical protein PVJ04_16470 [Gemmatimonadota bacterium]